MRRPARLDDSREQNLSLILRFVRQRHPSASSILTRIRQVHRVDQILKRRPSQLCASHPEHERYRIHKIRLPAPVRPHDARKGFKRSDLMLSLVRLKILHLDPIDPSARRRRAFHRRVAHRRHRAIHPRRSRPRVSRIFARVGLKFQKSKSTVESRRRRRRPPRARRRRAMRARVSRASPRASASVARARRRVRASSRGRRRAPAAAPAERDAPRGASRATTTTRLDGGF